MITYRHPDNYTTGDIAIHRDGSQIKVDLITEVFSDGIKVLDRNKVREYANFPLPKLKSKFSKIYRRAFVRSIFFNEMRKNKATSNIGMPALHISQYPRLMKEFLACVILRWELFGIKHDDLHAMITDMFSFKLE